MPWNPKVDCLRYKVKISDKVNFSKRDVLSDIAKLYDPWGLIGPIVTKAKIFIQELWKLKLDWSEQLPPDAMEKWKNFYQKLYRKVGERLSNADLPFEAKHQIINRWVFLYDKLLNIRQALTDITDFNICVRQPRYIKEDCISQNWAM
ncbi:uncharacterized protein TNCV_3349261 [Trichonephila clavipes]|nr:uncharacterized protein TNCV_3349261 [Trichonephila clavipes]